MKKIVPNLIRIKTNYDPTVTEGLLVWRYNRIIDNGYTFPLHDYYTYCALLLRNEEIDNVPQIMKNGNELKPEIKFEIINFQINNKEKISNDDLKFHIASRQGIVEDKKRIIKHEISRTNLNGKLLKTISPYNSNYYRTLLHLTREFREITLLDWFIPIVLTYERLIHIFIKHVEETKFGDGQFKHRTFFEYRPDEIWILLKTIVKNETQSIQEHFLENSMNHELDRLSLMKDYRRSSRNPIILNEDRFVLTIDKNGFIKQFHQL